MEIKHRQVTIPPSVLGSIPGIFTMGNLVCGLLSIMNAVTGRYMSAGWLILLGAFLDFLDGRVARYTKTSSRFGGELDSLADFCTFGIAPAVLMFGVGVFSLRRWETVLGIVYVLAGAFRLARYNVASVPGEKHDFRGLPIPMAALTIVGFYFFNIELWGELKLGGYYFSIVLLVSWLMVSNIPYWARLPAVSRRRQIVIRSVLITFFLILILIRPKFFIFPVFLFYILVGFVKEVAYMVKRISVTARSNNDES